MSKLAKAIKNESNITTTENGMGAKKTTMNANVDLFYKIAASRGKDMSSEFFAAMAEDLDTAVRILLWTRDVRGGAGERSVFRTVLQRLSYVDYALAAKIAHKVPELGRFDDLLCLFGTPAEHEALAIIAKALSEGNGLCGKWMPRKGADAEKLRKYLGLTPKGYRKLLVGLSSTVEQKMCANQWTEINYSQVPSLAAARYQKAFGKHDPAGYQAYTNALVRGDAGVKINASAVYPYDVVKSLQRGNAAVANQQWKSLPDFVKEGVSFLPLVDVSSSMYCPVGGNPNLTCIDVAISLGMYLAERNKSVFKDTFITFETNPKFVEISGDLDARYETTRYAEWGGSTDILKAFKLILDAAKKHNLSQEDLPEFFVILSDMQFNRADSNSDTCYKNAKKMFKDAGYTCPTLIFWNLNDYDNVPVKHDKEGTMLVSGCSPSIMSSVLGGVEVTPYDAMMNVIGVDRYKL